MAQEEGEFPPLSPPFPEGGLSDEDMEKQAALKQEAADALEDGNKELALEKYTAAIVLGTDSALLYSRRAQLLMQLGRPGAAKNDCNAALELNPDSGKAYKIRGRAWAKLELWEEAHSDFTTGLKIDYDEDTEEEAKAVAEKAKDISASKVKKRLEEEAAAQHKINMENKAKYEAGLAAREGELREERMKEDEQKQKEEKERRERVRKREKEEEARENSTAEENKDGETDTGPEEKKEKTEPPPAPAAPDVD